MRCAGHYVLTLELAGPNNWISLFLFPDLWALQSAFRKSCSMRELYGDSLLFRKHPYAGPGACMVLYRGLCASAPKRVQSAGHSSCVDLGGGRRRDLFLFRYPQVRLQSMVGRLVVYRHLLAADTGICRYHGAHFLGVAPAQSTDLGKAEAPSLTHSNRPW